MQRHRVDVPVQTGGIPDRERGRPQSFPLPRIPDPDLTVDLVSDTVTDMKVTARDFQRDFARMKAHAAAGEPVHVVSGGREFVFQVIKPKHWQGALKGKARINGDLFSTGLTWEVSQ